MPSTTTTTTTAAQAQLNQRPGGPPRLEWQLARVVDVQRETVRAYRIRLQIPNWRAHLPGQHLDARLTAPDGYTAQRSYSIASAPEEPYVELIVEALPDGEVSPYLTHDLRPGDELEVRGPVGGWFVWDSRMQGSLQLVAGGSGVVPFLAMIDHHRASGSAAEVRLLYSARTIDDVIARQRLSARIPHVGITISLTREAPPGWPGLAGRFDREAVARSGHPPEVQPLVMICGPTDFVETLSRLHLELGHRPEHLKLERFGASGGTP